jgi:hypothetical protein
MKFEPNKTYKTRSGEEAFIYCVDAPGALPIHGRIGMALYSWTVGGNIISICSHKDDLIAPEPERISRIVYVNDYKGAGIIVHKTEESARSAWGRPARTAIPCRLEEISQP